MITPGFDVDASNPEAERAFNTCIQRLVDAGWLIANDCDDAVLLKAAPNSEVISRISKIIDPRIAMSRDMLDADEHSILTSLGLAKFETDLAASVKRGHQVDKVVIGFNWVMVRAGDLCGIARSPSRDTEGARSVRPSEGFIGTDLAELAKNLKSLDPLARALGLAAVNCYWNRTTPPENTLGLITERGGLGSIDPPGEGAVIIGAFRGAMSRIPKARIVEREPKAGDIPVEEAFAAFATATSLSITAQTLMNGSLAPILLASANVPFRNLVGPSTPLCPIVFEHGLQEVFGAIIHDPDAAEAFILESGTMIMLDHICSNRTLRIAPLN